MNYHSFIKKIQKQYKKGLPFALFSEFGSNTIQAYLQQDNRLHVNQSLSEDGFVIAPFDSRLDTYLIPKAFSEIVTTEFEPLDIEFKYVAVEESETDQIAHENVLKHTIKTIKNGEAQKIVISRKKDFSLFNFSIENLINQLFSAYPTAWRYVWFHPETGIWCGATPEVLLTVKNKQFETMALAGTQPYKEGQVQWRKKEQDEQHFVTEAILDNLKDYVENVKVSELQTVRAGMLLHLKTDISASLKDEPGVLAKIVETMHPTPAVCGTPQDFSRNFIIENENYSREFYTGFIGNISDNGASASFRVNLRCMRIKNETAEIMVGGGITKDSDVDEEWVETQNKMQTMLQVIRPMLSLIYKT